MKMIEVVAAIIERDGKILLAQRPAQSDQAGLWEFAGGKVEPDESQRQALVRELNEELGIEATVGDYVASHQRSFGADYPSSCGTYPTSTGRYRHMNIRRWSGAHLKRRCNIRWPLLTFHY